MASAERGREPDPAGRESERDIELTFRDRDLFRRELARTFPNQSTASYLVDALVPAAVMPAWTPGMASEDWWTTVLQQFDYGITVQPYRRLLEEVVARYSANRVFNDLRNRYLSARPVASTCSVIVPATDDEQRRTAAATLASLRLEPTEQWSTAHAVCYATNSADVDAVRRALEGTELGWTVVGPDQPNYLLHELFVQGPDGSRFRLVDAPAQQTIGNLVLDVLGEYQRPETPGGAVPAVANLVTADGEHQRLDMDETLRDAGIQDGDSLAVGFEGRAGALHPAIRLDALDQAGAQIRRYARQERGAVARPSGGGDPPSAWELEFDRPGFGPPGLDTGEPTLITHHRVRIELGADYPLGAPVVFWLTPIFHPNVFPNYDSTRARRYPEFRGLVCIGAVDGVDTICRLVVDMAAYTNYSVGIDPDGPGGRPLGDFYDEDAAAWAARNGDAIQRRGGRPAVVRRAAGEVNRVIERLEP